jgi:hypothetical protein
MTIRLSSGLRNGLLNATGFTEAFNNGVLYVYSGPQPLTADAAVSGTLLGIVTQDAGAFAFGTATNGLQFETPSNGILVKKITQNWKFNGLADGVAGWFRLMGNPVDNLAISTTLPRLDGSCGTQGAGDMVMANIQIANGAPNTVDVFTFELKYQ